MSSGASCTFSRRGPRPRDPHDHGVPGRHPGPDAAVCPPRRRRLAAVDARDAFGIEAPGHREGRHDHADRYAKALAGEIGHFTGVSDPYEAPEAPDVVVRTDRESVGESLGRILATLEERRLLETQALEAAS